MTDRQHVRVLSLQAGGWGAPATEEVAANTARLAAWVEEELSRQPADLVVLPELATTPYFCCRKDERYREWAEPIPGPATAAFADIARRHGSTIVLPLFERGPDGHTYNAAAVIGPDGELVEGVAGDRRVPHYRKCHIPTVENPPDTEAWEGHFFTGGDALPVFEVAGVKVGVLICYDRWFPEPWRVLLARGAEIVVVPMVAWGFVEGPYLPMLISRAVENCVFVVTCNRSEVEELDGVTMDHFGRSIMLAPDGQVIAEAARNAGSAAVWAEFDLDSIARQQQLLPLLRDRRGDLYGELSAWS